MEIEDLWTILVRRTRPLVVVVVSNEAEFSGGLSDCDVNPVLICWCLEVATGWSRRRRFDRCRQGR